MLIAAIAIWLILLLLALAFCRAAASADSKDRALSARYPSRMVSLHPHPSLRQKRGPSPDRHGARIGALAQSGTMSIRRAGE